MYTIIKGLNTVVTSYPSLQTADLGAALSFVLDGDEVADLAVHYHFSTRKPVKATLSPNDLKNPAAAIQRQLNHIASSAEGGIESWLYYIDISFTEPRSGDGRKDYHHAYKIYRTVDLETYLGDHRTTGNIFFG